MLVYPLAHPFGQIDRPNFILEHVMSERHSLGMGGFIDDFFDSVFDAVAGLRDAMKGVIQGIANTVKKIVETVVLVVRAAIGDVKWSEVFHSLGEVFREIGNVIVLLNPAKLAYDWLSTAPITAHAFRELDKFTGGMITTAVNVSTLPGRALRGDPISKYELIQDALFIIQVAAVVYTGPVALGMMVGTMVGREICSKQTEAQEICMASFQIAGAAAGTWASAVSGVTWGAAAELTSGAITSAEEAAWLQGDEAYQAFLDKQAEAFALEASTSYMAHLSPAASQYLLSKGIDAATQELTRTCQRQGWAGSRECEILSQVAGNYARNELTTHVPWDEFLAIEIARIGAEELMLQWFPPESKEAKAIKRQWNIKYVDQPYEVAGEGRGKGGALLIAAGAAMLILGGLT